MTGTINNTTQNQHNQEKPVRPAASNPMSLGTLPIGKLLVQYSIPAIIASVAVSVYNIVDSIFIGRGVGPMAIAGLAITLPLMNLVMAFCTLIAAGAPPSVPFSWGRRMCRVQRMWSTML